MQTDKHNVDVSTREAKARRTAAKLGWRMEKSRARTLHSNNHGGYQLVDISRNEVFDGLNYEMTIDDVEAVIGKVAQ